MPCLVCRARQLKHSILFRCLLFFFQSELPLAPSIPGVCGGGCLRAGSGPYPWAVVGPQGLEALLTDSRVLVRVQSLWCEQFASPVPRICLRTNSHLLSSTLWVRWLDFASSVRDFWTFLWFYVSGVDGNDTSLKTEATFKGHWECSVKFLINLPNTCLKGQIHCLK